MVLWRKLEMRKCIYRKGKDCNGADYNGANCIEANYNGANYNGANCIEANCIGANYNGARCLPWFLYVASDIPENEKCKTSVSKVIQAKDHYLAINKQNLFWNK